MSPSPIAPVRRSGTRCIRRRNRRPSPSTSPTVAREFLSSGTYLFSRFLLTTDEEILRIDYDSRHAVSFAFSVSNYYLENIAHINSHQLSRNPDGTHTIVLRADRSRRANELSTGGLREGILMLREVRPAPDAGVPLCRAVHASGHKAGRTSAGEFDTCLGDG